MVPPQPIRKAVGETIRPWMEEGWALVVRAVESVVAKTSDGYVTKQGSMIQQRIGLLTMQN